MTLVWVGPAPRSTTYEELIVTGERIRYVPAGSTTTLGWAAVATAPAEVRAELIAPAASVVPLP
jgi:hypothetical protein